MYNLKKKFLSLCLLWQTSIFSLGSFNISIELLKFIQTNLAKGKTILELGSGEGTQELAKNYKIFSIEHDERWLNKYNTTYIYAPIKSYSNYAWYNTNLLASQLPKNYDLILIDGPTGAIGRSGFFYNLNLFHTNIPMIFDDVQRKEELKLLKNVASLLRKSYKIYSCVDGKKFGVIL